MKQDTLEGKAKTKNGVKRLCFSIICILLEVVFIINIVTRLNEYAEIINLFTRILSGILVLGLYASDKTSSMKMPDHPALPLGWLRHCHIRHPWLFLRSHGHPF